MDKEKLLEKIRTAVFEGKYIDSVELSGQARALGIPTLEIVSHLGEGVSRLVKKHRGKVLLDRLLYAAAAFQLASEAVSAEKTDVPKKGKVVEAVLEGPWTIGPEIVKAYLEAHNFEVVNAGSDVPVAVVVEKVKKEKPEVLAIGLYLIYRRHMVKELVGRLLKLRLRHKMRIILSGPAANEEIAASCGVDGYARDAQEVLELCEAYTCELNSLTESQKFQTLPRYWLTFLKIMVRDRLHGLLRYFQRKIYRVELSFRYFLHPEIKKSQMKGRGRILASLKGEPDRVPLALFSQLFSARFARMSYKDFSTRGEAMARAHIKVVRRFNADLITTSSDVTKIAQSCGAKVSYPGDEVPRFIEGALSLDKPMEEIEADWRKFSSRPIKDYVYNPDGQIVQIIKTIKLLKSQLGDEACIVGSTEGPFQGVALLFGANPFLIFLVREKPDLFKEMLSWYVEFAFETARAFKQAGADMIFTGESVAYYLSPEMFKDFCYEPEKKLYRRIREELGIPVLIHSCGNATDCLGFAAEVNPDGAIQIDDSVNVFEAKKKIGSRITIMGNLDGNRLLASGSPWQVEKFCQKLIKKMGPGGRYWLSTGCEIPRDTPPENIDAMLWVCRTAGKYPIEKAE